MSTWIRQLQTMVERNQRDGQKDITNSFAHLTMSANGSVYTAIVPLAGTALCIHGLAIISTGASNVLVRAYIAGSTAASSNFISTVVLGSVKERAIPLSRSIRLPVGAAMLIGMSGAAANSLPEAFIYYHIDS